jgi:hypothetical protein
MQIGSAARYTGHIWGDRHATLLSRGWMLNPKWTGYLAPHYASCVQCRSLLGVLAGLLAMMVVLLLVLVVHIMTIVCPPWCIIASCRHVEPHLKASIWEIRRQEARADLQTALAYVS